MGWRSLKDFNNCMPSLSVYHPCVGPFMISVWLYHFFSFNVIQAMLDPIGILLLISPTVLNILLVK